MIGTLGGNQFLTGLAHRGLDEADVADEPGNAVGLETGGLVGPHMARSERDVPLDHLRAERHGRDG